jgi:hypothetical protein
MSTRSVVVIEMQYDTLPRLSLYRHSDGYPAVAGAAILAAIAGATCPEEVAGRLLSMTYENERPYQRCRAIYHPTESADVHGDLEHVYTVRPVGTSWQIEHRDRHSKWGTDGDDIATWPMTCYSAADFAEFVNQEIGATNLRISNYRKANGQTTDPDDLMPLVAKSWAY